VLLSDVQRIEASTPFIKEANDDSLLTPEQQRLEQLMSQITKKDLEFVQSKDANLGKGSYGEVQLAKHAATGVPIAVKKIEKSSLTSSKIKETLIREIRIQKQLNHEYICRLYSSFEDRDTIYLALEYASKGNLFYLIRREKYLSEDTAFYFFIQVCSGIYYMHKQGLIHRDIKPENILIKEGNIIKICDFGWCV
jgi:non-specific serine/threonine protein kinase